MLGCSKRNANFAPAQIEQVIINLIKNAKESGSALSEVSFTLKQQAHMLNLIVDDRGTGLTNRENGGLSVSFGLMLTL